MIIVTSSLSKTSVFKMSAHKAEGSVFVSDQCGRYGPNPIEIKLRIQISPVQCGQGQRFGYVFCAY